jgi:folylpolyglutamate synthase
VCAFTSSILRRLPAESVGLGNRALRVGLFTSPHLLAVRERIRLQGDPLRETDFARYFFEVYDRLKEVP